VTTEKPNGRVDVRWFLTLIVPLLALASAIGGYFVLQYRVQANADELLQQEVLNAKQWEQIQQSNKDTAQVKTDVELVKRDVSVINENVKELQEDVEEIKDTMIMNQAQQIQLLQAIQSQLNQDRRSR